MRKNRPHLSACCRFSVAQAWNHYWTVTPPLRFSESTRARSSAWFYAGKSQAFR